MILKTKTLIRNILKSYQDTPIKKDHCACKIPQNREIKKIIRLTKELVFPGYFSTKNITSETSHMHTARLVNQLRRTLKRQIAYSQLYLADESKPKY